MNLGKRYHPQMAEQELITNWQAEGLYQFDLDSGKPVYSIDTPPPTVSGNLHLGHAFSYSHTDFIARYRRMKGDSVFYPLGFDDNGLPTERLVERLEGVRAEEIGRAAFVDRCLALSEETERNYEALFRRLGLSVDWHYKYRTIAPESRRMAQWSFLNLYRKGLVYRSEAPVIWCPTCHTALAQADVDDLQRETTFYTLAFKLDNDEVLPIATTRPELLAACVAVFIHPDDGRAPELLGSHARVPLFGHQVPVLADPDADPQKGTGVVMCCTFGDSSDIAWWYRYKLPLIEVVDARGQMKDTAGPYSGLALLEARRQIVTDLESEDFILARQSIPQTVRVHERCDTPIEHLVSRQWFVSVLDRKQDLLQAARAIDWHPAHMRARYEQWVQNLAWDWCISRQRAFGVPFPLWICDDCGEIILAREEDLPVDPTVASPPHPCPACGSADYTGEKDVMDTWATSSLTPQLAGQLFGEQGLYRKVFPFSLRPQAHEIIRTWAFYTIVKSRFHFDVAPWQNVVISGWGLAPEGTAKISKSRGGGPLGFVEAFEQYSADAIRYWAASTGPGKDSVIDERKIQAGAKLVTKLWNVAYFCQRFIETDRTLPEIDLLTPADRWILSRTHRLVARTTALMDNYDYATAKNEIEQFFWTEFADNYLEMAKKRLYDGGPNSQGASATLAHVLRTVVKLFAPFIPFVTDKIYRGLWSDEASVHASTWPVEQHALLNAEVEAVGEALVQVATAIRRYKSETNLALGAEVNRIHLTVQDVKLRRALQQAEPDIVSVTRAQQVTLGTHEDPHLQRIGAGNGVVIAIVP